MYSYGEFRAVPEGYQHYAQMPNDFSAKLTDFVNENAEQVRVFTSRSLPQNPPVPDGYSVIGIGDQCVKFHVRDIRSPEHAEVLESAYKSGNLLGLSYLAIDDSIKPKLVELINGISSVQHDIVVDSPSITVIDMSPSTGETGEELWEMFPDIKEQRMLKEMTASELAPALWGSGEFVFGSALPDVAINISPEKSIDICKATLETFPDAKEALLGVVLEKKNLLTRFLTSDAYTPEQLNRLTRLVELMDAFMAEHK